MGYWSLKVAAIIKKRDLSRNGEKHLEGRTLQTEFHGLCFENIHNILSELHDLYDVYSGFSSMKVRQNQVASYSDLMDANMAFFDSFNHKHAEDMKNNRKKAMTIINESETKSDPQVSRKAKKIGKQMLVWHQIVFKRNYQKPIKYQKEWMALQLKIAKDDPFILQNAVRIIFLSYFLVIINSLSGHPKYAEGLLSELANFRAKLAGIDPRFKIQANEEALMILKDLVKKIENDSYFFSSSAKKETVQKMFKMMKTKFGKSKSPLVEISQVIP